MLACELRPAGVDVLVLERRTEIDPTMKAGSVNLPTAEAFYRRGLLPPLVEEQRKAFERVAAFLGSGDRPKPPPVVGHFAGIMVGIGGVDRADPAFRDAGPAREVLLVRQQAIEAVLAERALASGVVRRHGGFDFPGTDPEITGRQAVVEMTGAEGLQPGWNRTDTGVYAHGPVTPRSEARVSTWGSATR